MSFLDSQFWLNWELGNNKNDFVTIIRNVSFFDCCKYAICVGFFKILWRVRRVVQKMTQFGSQTQFYSFWEGKYFRKKLQERRFIAHFLPLRTEVFLQNLEKFKLLWIIQWKFSCIWTNGDANIKTKFWLPKNRAFIGSKGNDYWKTHWMTRKIASEPAKKLSHTRVKNISRTITLTLKFEDFFPQRAKIFLLKLLAFFEAPKIGGTYYLGEIFPVQTCKSLNFLLLSKTSHKFLNR